MPRYSPIIGKITVYNLNDVKSRLYFILFKLGVDLIVVLLIDKRDLNANSGLELTQNSRPYYHEKTFFINILAQ